MLFSSNNIASPSSIRLVIYCLMVKFVTFSPPNVVFLWFLNFLWNGSLILALLLFQHFISTRQFLDGNKLFKIMNTYQFIIHSQIVFTLKETRKKYKRFFVNLIQSVSSKPHLFHLPQMNYLFSNRFAVFHIRLVHIHETGYSIKTLLSGQNFVFQHVPQLSKIMSILLIRFSSTVLPSHPFPMLLGKYLKLRNTPLILTKGNDLLWELRRQTSLWLILPHLQHRE